MASNFSTATQETKKTMNKSPQIVKACVEVTSRNGRATVIGAPSLTRVGPCEQEPLLF